jgi:GH15 family glucan-1,4-alpha-glucosidase
MDLALIGNCTFSALLENGAVRWLCWPRMDSSFVFGNLLDERQGGVFSVEALEPGEIQQTYLTNTNVVQTTFRGQHSAFELLDFAPRFQQYDRYYKPSMLVRVLRPLHGDPLVRVRCEPVYDYGRVRAQATAESNHLQYTGLPAPVRLTTDLSLTYVQEGRPFRLARESHMVLTWGQPLESPLRETAQRYLSQTVDYWRRWVKGMRIPRDYQDEVIRSALVLKLHQYEDTGALLAATTTSLPEFPGSGRTWDYRFCWLRDSYFTLNALERLGQTEEMERFLHFLRDRCAGPVEMLQPLYGIDGEVDLQERVLDHLAGYRGDGPVRIGNQASEHVQNDVYGEMILAISRLLVDTRFRETEGLSSALPMVEELLGQIEKRLEEPDAGLWELRNVTRLHAFTLLCHWAGAKRTVEIADVLGNEQLAGRARRVMDRARQLLEERCWDDERGVLVQAAGVRHLDAALLLALHFGFFAKDDPRAQTHVEAIRKGLAADGGLLMRYKVADDFGKPEAAFTVCSFWLVEALALAGRMEEACELFDKLLGYRNHLGLMSEDILPATGEQSGNFPQTYSHVGLINAAFKLSRGWE